MSYNIHPFAATYPIETATVQKMAEDMRANGFDPAHPVIVNDLRAIVIDGRTRLKAARIAGVEPVFDRRGFNSDAEIVEFIRRANDNRRGAMNRYQRLHVARLQADYLGVNPTPAELRQASGFRAQEVERALALWGTPEGDQLWRGERTALPATARPKRAPVTAAAPKEPTVDERLGAAKAKREADAAKREAKSLLAELEKAREVATALETLSAQPLPPIQRRELGSGLREATAVALASDWHLEEMVAPSNDTFGNAFNLSIGDLRVSRYFSAIEWAIRHSQSAFKIRDLVLWPGGDLTTGQLHDENLETGQLAPLEAMLRVQSLFVAGVRMLLDSDIGLERIDMPCSYGNHGRFTKRMRAGTGAGHNSDWLMYQNMAAIFADEPRVNIYADKAEHQFHTVYDYRLHFHHGHRVNYGGGVGGITIPVNKATSQWDKVRSCHYHHYGHFHQYIDTGSTIVNGSLIGFNAYAMSIKATPEVPQQAFYLLDSKRGKSTRMPLWVSDPSKERPLWSPHWTEPELGL